MPLRGAILQIKRKKAAFLGELKIDFSEIALPDGVLDLGILEPEETHPGEQTEKTDNFIFLNGNNRDFRPVNIERIESKYRISFFKFGGVDENPEITKIRILQAKMRVAQLDLGEKIGTVKLCGKHGRYEIKGESRK